ncbi:MAG: hypothetical protein AB7I08_06220 [Thermoleophilia bacterium]
MSLRALGGPRETSVETGPDGAPRAVIVGGRRRPVTAVRDDWLVQDLWWTASPVERHYHELVVEPGRVVLAYRDGVDATWHVHS